MDSIITLILICAGVSLLLNVVLKKFHVESVIGYIITGMVVGFAFDLENNLSLGVIAEFGIVFLMFTIGLEFSPEKLRLMKKEVFLFGTLQMLLTSALFFAVGHWWVGMEPKINLIVSLALSLSSTAIVLNLLTKSRRIGRSYGRNAVGVLLFQDIAVIPILLMVAVFSSGEQS
ncbi:MAG TPA: cation:proton antiporter, partial [Motiliproteus sp.]